MSHLLTLHDPARAREHYLSGTWQTDTLYSLAHRHAIERGSAFALRDSVRRLNWSTLVAWADVVAATLHEAGLRRGDRVSVWLPNRVEQVVIFLACSRNGYVCNSSLHRTYTVREVRDLLNRIESRALFAQPGYAADAGEADIFSEQSLCPQIKQMYSLSPVHMPGAKIPKGALPFPSHDSRTRVPAPPASTHPDQVVYLAFTSGTTGAPKGVMHSDNTLLANGRAMVADWGHDDTTIILTLSPMSHHIGTVALEQALVTGCELVMHDPSAGVSALDWIRETGATYTMGVPTHAIDLLKDMDGRGMKALHSVKVFYLAGAPIPTEVAKDLLKLGVTPQNVYGMTENGSHQYTSPDDAVGVITATCGKACSGYETKLWNPEHPDLQAEPGEIGEIGTRGGLLMLGYFSNQSATERSFNSSGWFLSGDLGRFDAHGNLQVVGRKKDLIIRGGHNIHPAHIEECVLRNPAIGNAAVFGLPDERLGERVCLVLICHGAPPPAEDILQHLAAEGLSRFDMPEYYALVDRFPLTASGKVLKREFVEWVATGRLRPQPMSPTASSK